MLKDVSKFMQNMSDHYDPGLKFRVVHYIGVECHFSHHLGKLFSVFSPSKKMQWEAVLV